MHVLRIPRATGAICLCAFLGFTLLCSRAAYSDDHTWNGLGDGVTWSDTANWDGGVAPTFGDNAAIPDMPGDVTIVVDVNITLNALTCAESVSLTSGNLTVQAASNIDGDVDYGTRQLIANNGAALALAGSVSGTTGKLFVQNSSSLTLTNATALAAVTIEIRTSSSLTASNLTSFTNGELIANDATSFVLPVLSNIDGTEIDVRGGGALSLPNVTSYVTPASVAVPISVLDPGSMLDLSALTEITVAHSATQRFDAQSGSTLDLSGLTSVLYSSTGVLRISADGGAVDLSGIAAFSRVELAVLDGGQLDASNVTSLGDGFLDLLSGTLNLNSLVNASNARFFVGDGTLQAPSLANLDGAELQVDTGKLLSLPMVTAVEGGDFTVYGTLQMDALTSFTNGAILVSGAAGSVSAPITDLDGTKITAANGAQFAPAIASYRAPDQSGQVLLSTGAGSVLQFPNLTTFDAGNNADVTLAANSGGVLLLSAITSISSPQTLRINGGGGTISLPNLVSAPNVYFNASGGVVDVPSLTAFLNGEVRITNGTINADAVTTLDGSLVLLVGASTWTPAGLALIENANLNLSSGFNWTLPATTTITNSTLNVSLGSTFNAPVMTEFTNGQLTSGNGSTVAVNALTNFDGSRAIAFSSPLTLPITSIRPDDLFFFQAMNPGGVLNLPNLTTIDLDPFKGGFTVRAEDGGQINMPALTTVTSPQGLTFDSRDPGSAIFILNLVTFDPLTVAFDELNFGIIAVEYPDDSDGDGLPDGEERDIYNTDPTKVDTDNDGMGDGFEIAFGLDPLSAADALLDPDDDTLRNVEEFRLRTDPLDAQSPRAAFYAAPDGSDLPENGTPANPWQNIQYALNQIAGITNEDFVLVLAPGTYDDEFEMLPRGIVAGSLAGSAIITSDIPIGVEGAQSAVLKNLTLRANIDTITLLRMNDVGVSLDRVTLDANGRFGVVGIQTSGAGPAGALITDCRFEGLDIGIDVYGAPPNVRRSVFENIGTHAIALRAGNKYQVRYGTFGGDSNPNAGFNTFEVAGNVAVLNERSEPVDLRNNDWGTEDAEEIDAAIDGPATFEPFRAAGSAILAATLAVNVWDSVSLAPLSNATVLADSFGAPADPNGVYLFASLPTGQYTVAASAEGYSSLSQPVSLSAGAIATLGFPLPPLEKSIDSDLDGLTDSDEVSKYGLNPNNPDTDGDGLTDDLEVAYGLIETAESTPADLNGDGTVDAVDVQLVINGALGLALPPDVEADINQDASVDAVDVQIVINIVLGVFS